MGWPLKFGAKNFNLSKCSSYSTLAKKLFWINTDDSHCFDGTNRLYHNKTLHKSRQKSYRSYFNGQSEHFIDFMEFYENLIARKHALSYFNSKHKVGLAESRKSKRKNDYPDRRFSS